jgi:hypothetical protein
VRFGLSFGARYESALAVLALGCEAEASGFEDLGVPDSPMLDRDPWAIWALRAQGPERARLGTLATNPVTRHPAVTAAASLTIHEGGWRPGLPGHRHRGLGGPSPWLGPRASRGAGGRHPHDPRLDGRGAPPEWGFPVRFAAGPAGGPCSWSPPASRPGSRAGAWPTASC